MADMNDMLQNPTETSAEVQLSKEPKSETLGDAQEPIPADSKDWTELASGQDPTWLDRSLASLLAWDWEKTAWLALLIVAAVIRLVALNNRAASHDESEHAWFAYNLYAGKGYEHSPVYHGPFIYHVIALFYLIFGASDVTARVPTALFGLGIVGMMWFTRRWLGKYGAFLAAALITFSPALLHYSRHTRHDIYELFWAVVLIIAVFRYLEARLGQGRALALSDRCGAFAGAGQQGGRVYPRRGVGRLPALDRCLSLGGCTAGRRYPRGRA